MICILIHVLLARKGRLGPDLKDLYNILRSEDISFRSVSSEVCSTEPYSYKIFFKKSSGIDMFGKPHVLDSCIV